MAKNTLARIKINNKHFEIMVDLDLALKLRKGEPVNIKNVLLADGVFTNHKTGTKASDADLTAAFGTADIMAAADRIVKKGDIQLPQDYREEQQDNRKKQVIDFLSRNAMDARTGSPLTPHSITAALEQAKVNITNASVEQQMPLIIEALQKVIPLRIETKKLTITIPAMHTGKVYGIISQYKEKEEWLSNGDLKITASVPTGLQSEFYDKLNAVTHGSAITEELKSTLEAKEVKKKQ